MEYKRRNLQICTNNKKRKFKTIIMLPIYVKRSMRFLLGIVPSINALNGNLHIRTLIQKTKIRLRYRRVIDYRNIWVPLSGPTRSLAHL